MMRQMLVLQPKRYYTTAGAGAHHYNTHRLIFLLQMYYFTRALLNGYDVSIGTAKCTVLCRFVTCVTLLFEVGSAAVAAVVVGIVVVFIVISFDMRISN